MRIKAASWILFFCGFLFATSSLAMDCEKAKTLVEHSICSNETLRNLDAQLNANFSELMSKSSLEEKNSYRQEQREWLKKRNKCSSDTNCLSSIMKERIQEIKAKNSGSLVQMPDSFYIHAFDKFPIDSSREFTVEAKGDLTGDGYEDAIVVEVACGASCSIQPLIVLNHKNIGASVHRENNAGYDGTEYFAGFNSSSAAKTNLMQATINNRVITFVGQWFLKPNTVEALPYGDAIEKAQYCLIGNKVTLLNLGKASEFKAMNCPKSAINSEKSQPVNTAIRSAPTLTSGTHLPDSFFIRASTDPYAKVLARGDLRGNGYEDAIVYEIVCNPKCNRNIFIALNEKNIKAKKFLSLYSFPNTYVGATSALITKIEIKNGLISLFGSGFQDPNDEDKSIAGEVQFRLEGNKAKLIKTAKDK